MKFSSHVLGIEGSINGMENDDGFELPFPFKYEDFPWSVSKERLFDVDENFFSESECSSSSMLHLKLKCIGITHIPKMSWTAYFTE